MAEEEAPIRVKLKIGDVEAEIECTEGQLKSAVELLLSAVQERMKQMPPVSVRPSTLNNKTCKGIIRGLWSEGWFSLSRNLREVYDEMSRRGFHFDRTAVAHALVDLVREGYLTRTGRPRSYRYLQKIPPSVE